MLFALNMRRWMDNKCFFLLQIKAYQSVIHSSNRPYHTGYFGQLHPHQSTVCGGFLGEIRKSRAESTDLARVVVVVVFVTGVIFKSQNRRIDQHRAVVIQPSLCSHLFASSVAVFSLSALRYDVLPTRCCCVCGDIAAWL